MHVLYVHKNYPAQFGHIANWLVRHEVKAGLPEQQGPNHLQEVPRVVLWAQARLQGATDGAQQGIRRNMNRCDPVGVENGMVDW